MIDGEAKNDEHGGSFGLSFGDGDALGDGFAYLPNWKTKLATKLRPIEMEMIPHGYSMMPKNKCHISVTAKMPDLPNQHHGQSFCF